MSKFRELFKSSFMELKDLRCITLTAMFGALSIVLGSLVLMVGDFLKIGFTFLPNEFVFYLFGPVVGMAYGAAIDILTFIIHPAGPYFFGFTLSGILTGLIYGCVLYKKPLSFQRIFIANLIQLVFINLLLNTYWLNIMYGYNFLAILPIRAVKAFIMFPIETIILYYVIKAVEATGMIRTLFPGKKLNA